MAQTLQSYITAVRYLLHDANANFYTNSQLTDYINGARARVVRDTGVSHRPNKPNALYPGGWWQHSVIWSSGLIVSAGDYVFSNIYIYAVTVGGILGDNPAYPNANNIYPPSTPFTSGTATVQYAGPSELINYSCLPSGNLTLRRY